MGTNSVISNLNYKDMISTIKLYQSSDFKKEKTYLIVEGDDDKKFFKSICEENVVICESFSGKKGIEKILLVFNENCRVFGVRDRDYEERLLNNKMFFYDYCCMEMMFININEVFEKIFYEYYDGDLKFQQLRKEILEKLKKLSVLRKVNEKNKKMWNFNGINIYNFFKDGNIKEEELYDELKRINNKKIFEDDIIVKEKNKSLNYEDLLNITNGHDFIDLFILYCKKEKNKNVKIKAISEAMRCACSLECFAKTILYQRLKAYEKENNIKIVK